MPKKMRLTQNEKNLIRRYLVWCYKTTKEELDKTDRYFTQLTADDLVLQKLKRSKEYRSSQGHKEYKELIAQFQAYMKKKKENVLSKKFKDIQKRVLSADYIYLKNRFSAIEEAIRYFLGAAELKKICLMYEQEMTRRILEAREHT